MKQYIQYYSELFIHKYKYFKYGKIAHLSLIDRIFHKFDMISPKVAYQYANALFLPNGSFRSSQEVSSNTEFLEFVNNYCRSHPYYIQYWRSHNYHIVPKEYILKFIVDRYVSFGCTMEGLLIANRDLFFSLDIPMHPNYSSQVNDVLRQLDLK